MSPYAKLAVGGDGVALRGKVPELANLGIDPVEDVVGWDRFAAILRDRTTPLKALLTDQHIIAGIGNIYADEILYTAGLRYDRLRDLCRRSRCDGCTARSAKCSLRRSSTAADAGRRAVRRSRRQARRLPDVPPRLRPRGRVLPPLPQHREEGHGAWPRDVLLRELPGLTTPASAGAARRTD